MATKESEQGREIMCDDVKDRSEPSRAAQLKYVIEKARVVGSQSCIAWDLCTKACLISWRLSPSSPMQLLKYIHYVNHV
jgi:hypothetical protein